MSTEDGVFSVNFATGQRYDLDYVRSLRRAFMPDGGHSWVISTIHGVDDPEKALDDMCLDAETFVGVTPIHCLLCGTEYETKVQHYKCPQFPQGT